MSPPSPRRRKLMPFFTLSLSLLPLPTAQGFPPTRIPVYYTSNELNFARTTGKNRAPSWLRAWSEDRDRYEYGLFINGTLATRMKLPAGTSLIRGDLSSAAPFFHSISPMSSHLHLSVVPANAACPHSPFASMLQCTYPLATDGKLRQSVATLPIPSLGLRPTFRQSKYYEAVDALTADVAYRHIGGMGRSTDNGIAMVTASHCHSRKLIRPDIKKDLMLRCYIVGVNRSSMDLRTDALQPNASTGEEELVNMCHTTMVAVDRKTLHPFTKGSAIPPLETDAANEEVQAELQALNDLHRKLRKRRQRDSMQLRSPASKPPNSGELEYLHQMFSRVALDNDAPLPRPATPPFIRDYTFSKHCVVYPESSNVQGKLFGGFIVEQAHNLATYAARFFAGRHTIIPLGMDNASFMQPIAIGDLLTFTARVVHSTQCTCRVLCVVEVRDPRDPERAPIRSNRLMFSFVAQRLPGTIVPESYQEALMHLDALRWHRVEGPTDEEAECMTEALL